MKLLSKITVAAVLGACVAAEAWAAEPAAAMTAIKKNWTPPAHKMLSQVLVDDVMARHPELLSLTL